MAYLITGVPGFIGSRLARALYPEGRALYLLCEPRFEARTRELAEAIRAERAGGGEGKGGDGAEAAPIHVVTGDITQPGCAIAAADAGRIRAEVREVYHLAAIYDLAVPEKVARLVNVEGTRNVTGLVASIPGCRLSYVSTCYVAGDRTGMVFEDELERGQGFKNHYESTKYEAERIVRAAMDDIETRIFRPSIVVGDSTTGETPKFDGPYFAFRAVRMGLLRLLPGASRAPMNAVPVDFVVEALAAIPKVADTPGKTFALADPHPLPAREVVRLVAERLGAPRPRGRIPPSLFKALLRPLVRKVGIPLESVDYFNTTVVFDTTNTRRALAGTGIACPPLPTYLNVILRYYTERDRLPFTVFA